MWGERKRRAERKRSGSPRTTKTPGGGMGKLDRDQWSKKLALT